MTKPAAIVSLHHTFDLNVDLLEALAWLSRPAHGLDVSQRARDCAAALAKHGRPLAIVRVEAKELLVKSVDYARAKGDKKLVEALDSLIVAVRGDAPPDKVEGFLGIPVIVHTGTE